MRTKHLNSKKSAEQVVKDICRVTRKQYPAEEKIRIVLDGLRGEDSIAELCRREGIAQPYEKCTGVNITKNFRLLHAGHFSTLYRSQAKKPDSRHCHAISPPQRDFLC